MLGNRSAFSALWESTRKLVGICSVGDSGGNPYVTFEILTKWMDPSRLVTRTKESNMYASIRVANP